MGRTTTKIDPSHQGYRLPSNTWFLGPLKSAPHCMLFGLAAFPELTNVTNRQTHRHTGRPRYSVCSSKLHQLLLQCGLDNTPLLSFEVLHVEIFNLTVDSSQLTFLPTSKSRDTKNLSKYQNSGPTKFRYCALV